ncbi:MAG: DUF4159 domain-containing protein [Pseudomonadota bacterium]
MGSLTLLAPLTLLGLLALPLVWWILKISPPAPKRRLFPPVAILKDIVTDEETPQGTPWWVLLYRLLMVALAVFALSLPLFQQSEDTGNAPVTLIIDDSAASAPLWSDMMDDARARLRKAQTNNQDVILIVGETDSLDSVPASEALRRLRSANPRPEGRFPDIPDLPEDRQTVFLSSGVTFESDGDVTASLRDTDATIALPPSSRTVIVPGDVRETSDGFEADWFSATSPRTAMIEALSSNGDVLAAAPLTIPVGQSLGTVQIALPPQLRARVTQLRVTGMRAGASTRLLDDSFGRPLVGVLAPPSGTSSPLLSEDFYAQQALGPFADLFIGDQDTVLSLNPSVLVMPDSMSSSADPILNYVESGGVLIRFAGPQLAEGDDTLSPVPLRRGGRSIGGALAWETPQTLTPFSSESPFAGLPIPDDVTVSRQVMARPGAETDARTWARLEDGSPVVTSAPLGDGRVVLFHVTAGPEWSNLAISGLYVDMLKRILPLAKNRAVAPSTEGNAWTLDRVLSPFGELRPPPPTPIVIADTDWTGQPNADHPPGYYRSGTRQSAIQAIANPDTIQPIDTTGLRVERLDGSEPQSFAGILLGIALIMLALDMLISAIVSGRFNRGLSLAVVMIASFSTLSPTPSQAQDLDSVGEAALGLHLAYIETGDGQIDEFSRVALESLSRELTRRTTIEPVGVHAVTPSSEGLVMYPFLYWPVRLDTPALTEEERLNINNYIAAGGTLVIDTADESERGLRAGSAHSGLARVTEGLTIGRLTAVPDDHVLTKSFYLTFDFPGRWAGGPVFVEAQDATQGGRDGVTSVIIGSNDWAAGWAIDPNAGTLADLSNDIPRQRELSIRFGVNIAMYALSGNYKADQVHAAELIRRLGQQTP